MREFRWTEVEVLRALELERVEGNEEVREFARISTDTRAIAPGDLFVALRGERFDAHEFLDRAAAGGARGAVVLRIPKAAPEELRYFVVADTLLALGALARYRRRSLRGRVVGVAGSNGKTTTKDLVRAALAPLYPVHATQGNLNNRVGLPLTLLATPDDAEIIILEMGTNEPGEIRRLTEIAEPEAGIITSIGEEHLEKLGSLDGVLREETELLAALPPHGIGFVADDPPSLPARARELLPAERLWVAGMAAEADLRPEGGEDSIEFLADGTTRWSWEGIELHLPLPGRYNVRNALLALGLARQWSVPPEEAARGIEAMPVPKLRGEWKQIGGLRVLADCYNANPPSVVAATELLAALPARGTKIAVLGTMREMGAEAAALHRRVAEQVGARVGDGIDRVVATGDFVEAFAPLAAELGERLITSADPVAAYDEVAAMLGGDETILLKASRGEALERWLPLLERDWAAAVPGENW
ncbi:MAG TPA: UDP-N-acetylmuramoyl-tripeptide--D-alanyl-D-alanine ligase [Longimicrobiaceae bacterium]|nr:UDP-N-acetylmuramoyl-tripeptide--D-alanyl-D-alanine ligase [Longimicrobiaceae bacterium]